MDVDETDMSVQTHGFTTGAEGGTFQTVRATDTNTISQVNETRPGSGSVRTNMISRIALSEAHFKHQQRGEPDLTFDEKSQIANDLLDKSPSIFLSRFKQYLTLEDTEYFKDLRDDYEINFHLKDIMQQHDTVHSMKVVKNRRYAAMQELMKQGDYFSDDEMKWRQPLLYEQMVGKYLTEEEIQSQVDKTDLRFSNILLKHMDQLEENVLYARQKEAEECQEEEEDEESEEEEMSEEDEDGEEKKPKISPIEKQMLKAEFLQIMQERFISGKDKDFDYSEVDRNIYYDSLETLEKDEEEKYFDEEEACLVDHSNTDSPCRVDSPRLIADEIGKGREVSEANDDYMNFQMGPDVTAAASEFHKMAVSSSVADDNMSDNG